MFGGVNGWRVDELKVCTVVGKKVWQMDIFWLVWEIAKDLPNFPAAKHSHYNYDIW